MKVKNLCPVHSDISSYIETFKTWLELDSTHMSCSCENIFLGTLNHHRHLSSCSYYICTCLLSLAILYFISLYVFLLCYSAHCSLAKAMSSYVFAIIPINEKKREGKRAREWFFLCPIISI